MRVCKELITALEERNVQSYTVAGQPSVTRNLSMIKEKITKYDAFLLNNKHELDSKEYAQSLGLLQQQLQPTQ